MSSNATELVTYIIEKAIEGLGPLSSAEILAWEYLNDSSYVDNLERARALVRWEKTKNFTTGFITGLGGFITLPFAIPSALVASWIIQARMVAAIAMIFGHDIQEDRVKTAILLTLLGDVPKEILKQTGVKVTSKLTNSLIQKIPAELLKEINRQVGFRLLSKAGEKGLINFTKAIPFVGGLVSGGFDAYYTNQVGELAIQAFQKDPNSLTYS